jgi:hypothetical protein
MAASITAGATQTETTSPDDISEVAPFPTTMNIKMESLPA